MKPTASARTTVDVALAVDAAFEAFTAEIGEWYVVDRFTVPDPSRVETVRIEPQVGGRLLLVEDPETGEGRTVGTLIGWDPPHGLTFVDGRGIEVGITFSPVVAGGCRVTVEVRGIDALPPDEAAHVRRHGWHRYLPGWFATHVARKRAPT